MDISTTTNVEDSAINELMGALGMTEKDLPERTTKKAQKAERVAIEEVSGKAAAKPIARHYHANQVDRLKDNLGGGFNDALLLTHADQALQDDARAKRSAEVAGIIKKMGKKAQNRVAFLVEYASGRTTVLNNVMRTALTTLTKEEKLTTGKDGNLVAALVASGKTIATSKAMAGNTILALEALQVIKRAGDHAFIANPESALMERLIK